ncbi:aspartic proteinase CDR1-like [Herrania umbratica]|uniref:Aspartic proteinase CDR1-like n=1 Tax=Herrania umbratica TaxID=108875 RepID=A0A6J1BH27_9ROSI|nr:aspartic proteinase CDR1-like [Herrania umbratica]
MMHNPPFLLLSAIFFSGLVIQSVVGPKTAYGFSVELIHRDSPLSPFFNDSITSSELLRKNALHSMDRIKNIQSYIDQKATQSVVIPNGGSYLMKLSFGTPPVEYLAIADTGSDLTWIQCAPCPQTQCYSQGSSPFDPAASSTYQKLSCVSEACQALARKSCLNTNECEYFYSYGDNSYTMGILSSDTLSFDSSSSQKTSFPTSFFGCGHNNQGNFRRPGAGLVGLGGGPLSLISQIGTQIDHRFSYCLVPRSATSSGKLIFGQEAIISRPGAVSTPLITKTPATFYYLNLESISIGDKTAQAASSQGNIIIDSGTTLTILESNFYNSVETMVKEAIGAEPKQDPSGTFSLCYGAETNIPDMLFHFTGADLRLQPVNTFGANDGLLCMLIVPSNTNSNSIFGNFAQINFQVEYDLQKRTVSFAPTDCTKQ